MTTQHDPTDIPDPVRCPECAAGKHANCNGDAWDDDGPTICVCWAHGHNQLVPDVP